jgi:hypothetical protein
MNNRINDIFEAIQSNLFVKWQWKNEVDSLELVERELMSKHFRSFLYFIGYRHPN